MNIVILINSNAGGGKFLKNILQIENFLESKKINFKSIIDVWPDNLDEYNYVWVIGGDGTLNYFINKYPLINIPIAIFKGGTGNDFSWKLYGNICLEEQLQKLFKNKTELIDVGLCNGKYFLNGVGIGFDGEILKSMNKIRWLGGHLGYLVVVIKKIFTFKEQYFTFSINENEYSQKLLLMSVFNSSRTGGGFHIAPTAKINDGFLDVITCKPLNIIKRLINLPKIEKGKHLKLPFVVHYLTKKINIKCETKTAAQIDGELFWAKEFNISIIEKKLTFIV